MPVKNQYGEYKMYGPKRRPPPPRKKKPCLRPLKPQITMAATILGRQRQGMLRRADAHKLKSSGSTLAKAGWCTGAPRTYGRKRK